jgi:hypothetical protein
MPRESSLVLATDREVQPAKPHGERAEFRIKGARNLVLRITLNGAKSGPSSTPALPAASTASSPWAPTLLRNLPKPKMRRWRWLPR